jgi:hypothetical protein
MENGAKPKILNDIFELIIFVESAWTVTGITAAIQLVKISDQTKNDKKQKSYSSFKWKNLDEQRTNGSVRT